MCWGEKKLLLVIAKIEMINLADPCSLVTSQPANLEEKELKCGMKAELQCGENTCLR